MTFSFKVQKTKKNTLEVFYVLDMKLKFLYLSTIYDFGP